MASPTTTAALPDTVRRLLRARIDSTAFELPLLPSTTAEILALARDEDCEARALAERVERDATMAAYVLRVSNSAAYAPKEQIVSLQQATSRLGIGVVAEIAMSIALRGRVFDVAGYEDHVQRIWRHSAVTAHFAREVARTVRHNVEGAYLCGLLHDVGKPLVMQALVDVARQRTDRPVPAAILEAAMAEFHQALGARLAELWELSPWVVEAVGFHHDYERADRFRKEATITRLADLLAHWAVDATQGVEGFPAQDPVLDELGIYGEELERLFEHRDEAVAAAEAFS